MKKRVEILIILLLIAVFLIPTQAHADSFKFVATPNKTSLKAGDTVTIEMGVASINAGELGINAIEGKLVYDETIFEEVTQSSFTALNGWALTYNNENTAQKGKMLGVILSSGVTKDQSFGKITLKVKSDVTYYKETAITIKNIATNNGEELITDTDKTIKLTIGTKPTPTPTTTPSSKPSENGGSTNTPSPTPANNTNKKADSTTARTTIPQTGEEGYIIITTIGTLASLSIIGILGMKKYKDII